MPRTTCRPRGEGKSCQLPKDEESCQLLLTSYHVPSKRSGELLTAGGGCGQLSAATYLVPRAIQEIRGIAGSWGRMGAAVSFHQTESQVFVHSINCIQYFCENFLCFNSWTTLTTIVHKTKMFYRTVTPGLKVCFRTLI
jgi:hypothetical protein